MSREKEPEGEKERLGLLQLHVSKTAYPLISLFSRATQEALYCKFWARKPL